MGSSVALIGFMGSGKSHVGMLVASLLRLPFVDTDALIAEQLGPIETIFDERGEAYFRAVECQVCRTVLEKSRRLAGVVSLGGGAVMAADVRSALGLLPHVVWLTAPLDVLFGRAAEGGRPLARDRAAFERLFRDREAVYRSVATVQIANDGRRTADEVAAEVAAHVRV